MVDQTIESYSLHLLLKVRVETEYDLIVDLQDPPHEQSRIVAELLYLGRDVVHRYAQHPLGRPLDYVGVRLPPRFRRRVFVAGPDAGEVAREAPFLCDEAVAEGPGFAPLEEPFDAGEDFEPFMNDAARAPITNAVGSFIRKLGNGPSFTAHLA